LLTFLVSEISYDLWKGYLLAKGHEEKPYRRVEWYDLLHPLSFYPNLEWFCHAKEIIGSYAISRVPQTASGEEMERTKIDIHKTNERYL
jgi:hypothetical protein